MPEHDINAAAITAGVERAITKLLTAPDLDGAFYDAVRQVLAMQLGDRGSILRRRYAARWSGY